MAISLTVIIPTLNEGESIGPTIDQIPRNLPWLDVKVLIVDGNSTDNTAEEAEKRGAIVHNEPRKGYGRAYKTGFSIVDTDYVATIDGDTTYPADKIPHVLAFLINNNLDFVIIFASFFSIGILLLAGVVPALPNSPIDDVTFNKVFALSPIAVLASMMAYLFAQFIDIRIYHFWKNLTKGRHLWLRNNFSTFASQFIDTFTVVGLLCVFGVLPWAAFLGLLISGVVFKILVALIDTPLLYLSVNWIRSYYKLEINEEIKL